MTARCAEYVGALKVFENPWDWVRPRLLLPKFLMDFCSDRSYDVRTKFEVRSFIHSWDNRGYSKNLDSPWIRPRSLFSQIFNGLLFGWTCECPCQRAASKLNADWCCSKYLFELCQFTHESHTLRRRHHCPISCSGLWPGSAHTWTSRRNVSTRYVCLIRFLLHDTPVQTDSIVSRI